MTTVTPAYVRPLEGAVLRQAVASGTPSLGDAVYISDDSNNIIPVVSQSDANLAASAVAHGILVAVAEPGDTAATDGAAVTICVFGPVSGYAGMTPGARQFVSETPGAPTATAPSGSGTWTSPVGYAESDGVLFVLPGIAAPSSNS